MKTFIIAEAGVNHNGSIKIAKKLIDVASKAGVDAVKFQTFKAEDLVIKNAAKTSYQRKNTNIKESQFEMLKKYQLSYEDHKKLYLYCKFKKIIFISSPFDNKSIDLLDDLGLDLFKIPSGEINNLPYLRHLGKLKKKIILSTGMSNIFEVKNSLETLIRSGTKKKNIILLHSNTEYPTPFKDVNLKAMTKMGKDLNIKFGYSDHTLGIEVAIAAVAMGANCIEKHFTLDRNMVGPDHKASLEPQQLKKMVSAIRNIELALGNSVKKPSISELKNIKLVRKSIVSKKKIKKGEVFNVDNIDIKRPGTGISPMKWDKIIGTSAKKNYDKDELI